MWQAWRQGRRIVEVPITFVERERGQSKMSRDIVAEALWRVTWWGVRAGGVASPASTSVGAADGCRVPMRLDAGSERRRPGRRRADPAGAAGAAADGGRTSSAAAGR